MVQLQHARGKVSNQPAGRSYNNIHIILNTTTLLLVNTAIAPAKYGNRADAGKIGKAFHLLIYLLGKFARGRQYQGTGMMLICFADMLQHWQQVSAGFAGAGLRAGNNIAPAEDDGYGHFLYGGWCVEPHALNAFE